MTPHRANHDYWHDLIPFYVNRSLVGPERDSFEQHLRECPACRQQIDDWHTVAHAVYQDVAEWVRYTPPLSAEVRAVAQAGPAPSTNGRTAAHTTYQSETTTALRDQRGRRARRSVQLPLTLAAAAVLIVVCGAMLIYLATNSGDDSTTTGSEAMGENVAPPSTAHPTDTPLPMLGPATAGPSALPPTADPLYAQPPDLGIMGTPQAPTITPLPPSGIGAGGAGDSSASSFSAPEGYVCQAASATGSAVPIRSMPEMPFADNILSYLQPGQWLDVFQHTYTGWYQLVGTNGRLAGWVSIAEITLSGPCDNVPYPTPTMVRPLPTPTAMYGYAIGSGFVMMTTRPVDQIPGETLVRISHAWFDGSAWWYHIVMQDQWTAADARVEDITLASGDRPGPTPTARFNYPVGSGFDLVLIEPVSNIAQGTAVSISSAWYDGINWYYNIVTQNGATGVARQDQLTIGFPIELTPSVTPVRPPATPTAMFNGDEVWNDYYLIMAETVGSVRYGERVRITSAWYTNSTWFYSVITRNNLTADVRQDQLLYVPPTPTTFAQITPTNVFAIFTGNGEYRFVTREQIEAIPARAVVRIDAAWYSGAEWHYTITTPDGISATARQSQIQYPPPEFFLTLTPNYTPTPTPNRTQNPSPAIQSFTADPDPVAAGASITLAWQTTNTTSVSVREITANGKYGDWYNDLSPNGTLSVTAPDNGDTRITYQIVLTNGSGQEVTGQLSVTITPAP